MRGQEGDGGQHEKEQGDRVEDWTERKARRRDQQEQRKTPESDRFTPALRRAAEKGGHDRQERQGDRHPGGRRGARFPDGRWTSRLRHDGV